LDNRDGKKEGLDGSDGEQDVVVDGKRADFVVSVDE